MPEKEFGVLTTVAKADENADRVIRFRGTTPIRDRQGDEIPLKGWKFEPFLKNPVVPWAHRYDEPPVGKVTEIVRKKNAWEFAVEFAEKEDHPLADRIFKLVKKGFINAVSVGFRSLKSKWIDPDEDEEKARAEEEPDARPGKVFKEKELLELSIVPVPCNPEALVVARSEGMELPKELDEYLDRYVQYKASKEALNYTKDVKERLASDNVPDMAMFKDFLEAHSDEMRDLLERIIDDIDVLKGQIHELKTGESESGTAQPSKEKAESDGTTITAVRIVGLSAPSDQGDAESVSEEGPEHVNKVRLV